MKKEIKAQLGSGASRYSTFFLRFSYDSLASLLRTKKNQELISFILRANILQLLNTYVFFFSSSFSDFFLMIVLFAVNITFFWFLSCFTREYFYGRKFFSNEFLTIILLFSKLSSQTRRKNKISTQTNGYQNSTRVLQSKDSCYVQEVLCFLVFQIPSRSFCF